MVGRMKRPRKRADVCFADPPWNERSAEWQMRDQQVPANHPARAVVEAMKQLDLMPLFALYGGAGTPPIRPDLMLAIVLIEMRSGRPQPLGQKGVLCRGMSVRYRPPCIRLLVA
jgi:hypothetical protein